MTIGQLTTFLIVARCKSLRLASEELFLSQPSISARIKALEKELSVTLFEREGRGTKLTDNGEKFILFARKMVRTYAKARSDLKNGGSSSSETS